MKHLFALIILFLIISLGVNFSSQRDNNPVQLADIAHNADSEFLYSPVSLFDYYNTSGIRHYNASNIQQIFPTENKSPWIDFAREPFTGNELNKNLYVSKFLNVFIINKFITSAIIFPFNYFW